MLLKGERRERPARKIVVHAAIAHRRPVAYRTGGKHARLAGQRQQLLEALHAVKDARAACAHNGGLLRLNSQHIAFRLHGGVKAQLQPRQHGLGLCRIGAQQHYAISARRSRFG